MKAATPTPMMPGIRIGKRHVTQPLPGVGAEIARGFFPGAVEAVDHREHQEQPERQRPGELGGERRGEQARLDAEKPEARPMPKPTSRLGITRLATAR